MKIKEAKKIVISRTDSIGDVALTLPLVGILKEKFTDVKLIFLGNTYTEPIINCIHNIDEVWSWAELKKMEDRQQVNWLKSQNVDVFIHVFPRREIARLAQKAQIKHRIGTSHRLFHMLTCNHRVNFSRKKSNLHEAQLNTKLLKPLAITHNFSLRELHQYLQFNQIEKLEDQFDQMIDQSKKQIILHPKSKGSALEWGVNQFIKLAESLSQDQFQIFFTGTEDESKYFRNQLPRQDNIIDLSGKMSLQQLIAFINACEILVAASTGPLHIAGLCNINCVGLFTTRRPLHSGRWRPLGSKVNVIEEKHESERNQNLDITVKSVKEKIEEISGH
ncbi:MAG: glycosyltransferase family 9 protein [Crocinitomicaceae bacterium]